LGAPDVVRDVTLNEEMSANADVPIHADLGTGAAGALGWDDELTEICYTGDVEEWRVLNLTGDAHPIHIHINFFQVLGRQPFNAAAYQAAQNLFLVNAGPKPDPLDYVTGPERLPESWESGWKDTLIAYPDEITRLAIRFDIPGLTVWHCHILEHEDNEMMRPLLVLEKTHLPFIANGEAPPAEGG
ncbi:MAG TPA: multicopper oxidase domain-containing protein, partial [Anaerolineales bacterium]|nr:multicopper oxidase domain-containing protein [Anaerolineales bacterium]